MIWGRLLLAFLLAVAAPVTPEARYLGGGRIAAIANAAGRPPSELIPALNEQANILRLFNERVLEQRVPINGHSFW